jgi:hypothetical protein
LALHTSAAAHSSPAITFTAAAAAAAGAAFLHHLNYSQVRKQAEEAVQNVANRPEVVAETLRHVQHAANPEVRQLAAVLLRKWVPRHWTKLPAEVRTAAGTQNTMLAATREMQQQQQQSGRQLRLGTHPISLQGPETVYSN